MRPVLSSPYRTPPRVALRGNLHTHSTLSDGTRDPQAVIDDYAARGYDFLALTDHDLPADPGHFDSRGLVLLRGNEVTAHGPHLVHLGANVHVHASAYRQEVLDHIAADAGSLAVLAHPNWLSDFDHWSMDELMQLRDYAGIEIFSGMARRQPGSALATDKWDRLLSMGRQVWGFSGDDSHWPDDVGKAWVVAWAADKTAPAILQALREGSFYCSTGVEVACVRVIGRIIHICAPNAQLIRMVSDWGYERATVYASEMTFEVPDGAPYSYLRAECIGCAGAMAWTQPVRVSIAD
jgi:hypothetical protein